jgi:hypothetical protein
VFQELFYDDLQWSCQALLALLKNAIPPYNDSKLDNGEGHVLFIIVPLHLSVE